MFFKKNRYYSDGSISIFENKDSHINITSWEDGCQLSSYHNGIAITDKINPDFSIFKLSPLLDPNYFNSPIYKFRQSIPNHIVSQISKFQFHQVYILNLVANNVFAQDLLKNNAVLLWMTVDWMIKNNKPTSSVNKLLVKKNIIILRTLQPNANESQLKFIKSLNIPKYDKSILTVVYKVLVNKEILFKLRHSKNITYSLLNFIANMDFDDGFESRLTLLIVSHHQEKGGKSFSEIYKIYVDTIKLNQRINSISTHPLIDDKFLTINKLISSYAGLLEKTYSINYADEIKESIRLRQLSNSNQPCERFPKEFINGTKYIVHISTYASLEEEAVLMNTCVINYSEQILREESCLYKVIYPERGTVELKINDDGVYLSQFYLKENKIPSAESFARIEKWIGGHKT